MGKGNTQLYLKIFQLEFHVILDFQLPFWHLSCPLFSEKAD
jgi:hypothetical protein